MLVKIKINTLEKLKKGLLKWDKENSQNDLIFRDECIMYWNIQELFYTTIIFLIKNLVFAKYFI
jgi:hypothetical protein